MRVDILSLFPEYFTGPFDQSMIKQVRDKGILDINLIDIRDFAEGKHRQVDDRPYGGGPGMVLMPEPVVKAIRSVKTDESHTVYLTPQGEPLSANKSRQLSKHQHLILVCGHYEGIDERAIQIEVDEEISIGDYVLTNGCIAAIVVVDAMMRFIPGALGHEQAAEQESFENSILDYPHFTRPEEFLGMRVPEVLLSGHHQKIRQWRQEQAYQKTKCMRPDLIKSLKQD